MCSQREIRYPYDLSLLTETWFDFIIVIIDSVPIKYWKILEWVSCLLSNSFSRSVLQIIFPHLFPLLYQQLIWFNFFLGLPVITSLQKRQLCIWQCLSKHWKIFSIPRGLFDKWICTVNNIRTQPHTNKRQYRGPIVYHYSNIRRKESIVPVVPINWRIKFWMTCSY
jgi:hypothetical protein